jgi:hypothetical protein
VLVVIDAANVVGSVPDGWWRDPAGATERLRDALAAAGPKAVPGAATPAFRTPAPLLATAPPDTFSTLAAPPAACPVPSQARLAVIRR